MADGTTQTIHVPAFPHEPVTEADREQLHREAAEQQRHTRDGE
jgi:hypothetical protein